MNSVLKIALVIGVFISVEVLVLRHLFTDMPRILFVGAFLVASILLVVLQYGLLKRRSIRLPRRWSRRSQRESSPVFWNGLDPSIASTTNVLVESKDRDSLTGPTVDPALPDENGIIKEKNS